MPKDANITGDDTSNIPAAVEAAKNSDVVVLVIGGTSSTFQESVGAKTFQTIFQPAAKALTGHL